MNFPLRLKGFSVFPLKESCSSHFPFFLLLGEKAEGGAEETAKNKIGQ